MLHLYLVSWQEFHNLHPGPAARGGSWERQQITWWRNDWDVTIPPPSPPVSATPCGANLFEGNGSNDKKCRDQGGGGFRKTDVRNWWGFTLGEAVGCPVTKYLWNLESRLLGHLVLEVNVPLVDNIVTALPGIFFFNYSCGLFGLVVRICLARLHIQRREKFCVRIFADCHFVY